MAKDRRRWAKLRPAYELDEGSLEGRSIVAFLRGTSTVVFEGATHQSLL